MLFFISGISMSIGVNSYLRKQREKERAMAFFHTALPTAREKVITHLGLVVASCWRLSHLLAIGVLFNIIRVHLSLFALACACACVRLCVCVCV
jgi:hypothetical protein